MASLKKLTSIPSLGQLYRAGKILASTKTDLPTGNQALNDKICTVQYDLTKLEVDAIVNAANSRLLGGGGVDGAIHRAAGPKLLAECRTLGGCKTGSAKITDAYNLPCKKVIHAVGPVYDSQEESEPLLKGCYRTALQLAVDNDCKSVAFSAISTGIYGYPSDEAAEAALSEVKSFLEKSDGDKIDKVIFCNFLQKDVDAYTQAMPEIFPPVDENAPEKVFSLNSMGEKDQEAVQSETPNHTSQNASVPNASAPIAKSDMAENYGETDPAISTQTTQVAAANDGFQGQPKCTEHVEQRRQLPSSNLFTMATNTLELSSSDTHLEQEPALQLEPSSEGILRSYDTGSTPTFSIAESDNHLQLDVSEEAKLSTDTLKQENHDSDTLLRPALIQSPVSSSSVESVSQDLHVTKAEVDEVKNRVHMDIRRTSNDLLKTMAETRDKCALLNDRFDESLVHVKELGEQLEKIESKHPRTYVG